MNRLHLKDMNTEENTPVEEQEEQQPEQLTKKCEFKLGSTIIVLVAIAALAFIIWLIYSIWSSSPETQPEPEIVVEEEIIYSQTISHETIGDYVADGEGMTLYTVDEEKCPTQCIKKWTPYMVKGEHYALDGEALYHYSGDENEGDVTGDGFYFVGKIARP